MRRVWVQILLGVAVLAAGGLLLFEAIGDVSAPPPLWATALTAAGVAFWGAFFLERSSWWAAIPGAALLGAAMVTLMPLLADDLGQWTEVPFLGITSLGFWAVYLRDTRRWWALFPAGALLTLAVVTALADSTAGAVEGAVFLLGGALTFALVAALPGGSSSRWWAWIPAGALAVGAAVVLLSAGEWVAVLTYVWPVAVIAAGAYLIWRAARQRRRSGAGELPSRDAPQSAREPSAPAQR